MAKKVEKEKDVEKKESKPKGPSLEERVKVLEGKLSSLDKKIDDKTESIEKWIKRIHEP